MIKDNIKNSDTYNNISENIKKGFEWLKSHNLVHMEDGKYEINDKMYVNLQSYETKSDAKFEAHRDYIDIQYMVIGSERCGVTHYNNCVTETEYDADRDIEFLSSDNGEYFTLNEGEFFIFFPQDAHKPALCTTQKNNVKKAVVKVHI